MCSSDLVNINHKCPPQKNGSIDRYMNVISALQVLKENGPTCESCTESFLVRTSGRKKTQGFSLGTVGWMCKVKLA